MKFPVASRQLPVQIKSILKAMFILQLGAGLEETLGKLCRR